jgi:hypothetical protein
VGRPTDWTPLASSDPVPGDPNRVWEESNHLFQVANQITEQIGRLRAIAASSDSHLKGQYADKLRSTAQDLVGQLGKVHDRYETVGSALQTWEPALQTAQQQSLAVLQQAKDAYQRQQQYGTAPAGQGQQQETAAQKHARQTRLDSANGDLAAAQRLLNQITGQRDQDASSCANKINQAGNDSLKDSWWDSFCNWVSQYAGIISAICTVLEIIATILAVVALLFLPGVGWVILAGLIAGGLALLGRTMLASTGNGSWLDVAFDVLSLLSFGLGGRLLGAMKGIVGSSEKIAQGLIQAERDAALLGKAGNVLDSFGNAASKFADFMHSTVAGNLGGGLLGRLADGLATGASKFADTLGNLSVNLLEKASPSLAKVSEATSAIERILTGGDQEAVTMARKMAMILDRWPANPSLLMNDAAFNNALNIFRANFAAGEGLDLFSKFAGGIDIGSLHLHLPGTQFYGNWQKSWTAGLNTTEANVIVDTLAVVPSPVQLAALQFSIAHGTW